MCKRYNVTDFDLLVVVKEQEVLMSIPLRQFQFIFSRSFRIFKFTLIQYKTHCHPY